jgi:hypothetical protein
MHPTNDRLLYQRFVELQQRIVEQLVKKMHSMWKPELMSSQAYK